MRLADRVGSNWVKFLELPDAGKSEPGEEITILRCTKGGRLSADAFWLQGPIGDDGQWPRSSKTFVNCLPAIVFCRGLVLRTATIGTAMIDEKIKIKCSKCSKMFRERAQKIREGFQMQCPHCLKLLTFDGSSDDNNIRRALKSAKELRTALEAARQDSARASSPADQ